MFNEESRESPEGLKQEQVLRVSHTGGGSRGKFGLKRQKLWSDRSENVIKVMSSENK